MRYAKLGSTGLEVSTISLGTAMFGFPGLGHDETTAQRIFDAYREGGGTFIDTADAYGDGASEEIVGRLLAGRRDDFVLATKVGQRMGSGPNAGGLSRRTILRGLEASLRRLQTDHIDLYQLHSTDPWTPMEETLEALGDCVHAGKVRYVGCSNIDAWRLAKANALSRDRGLVRFASAQLRYSLLSREIEREHIPLCAEDGLGVIVFNPLAAGILSGKVGPDGPPAGSRVSKTSRYAEWLTPESLNVVAELVAVANELGAPAAAVALAWALGRPGITAVINGASSVEQMQTNLTASDLDLPEEARRRLDEASARPLGYPYDFMISIEEHGMRVPGQWQAPWPAAWSVPPRDPSAAAPIVTPPSR